jgi:hypothetical protein
LLKSSKLLEKILGFHEYLLKFFFIDREEANLRELIQDIAASAIRGVQLDIRLFKYNHENHIVPILIEKPSLLY